MSTIEWFDRVREEERLKWKLVMSKREGTRLLICILRRDDVKPRVSDISVYDQGGCLSKLPRDVVSGERRD